MSYFIVVLIPKNEKKKKGVWGDTEKHKEKYPGKFSKGFASGCLSTLRCVRIRKLLSLKTKECCWCCGSNGLQPNVCYQTVKEVKVKFKLIYLHCTTENTQIMTPR